MDRRVKALLAFARTIKPGWHADIVAKPLLAAMKTARPRRLVAEKNIDLVFPGISRPEKNKLLAQSYDNMVWSAVEMCGWQRDPELINEWTFELSGREYLDDALAKGNGAILVTGHIGNWEHAAAWVGHNYNMLGIAQHSDSPFQKELITALRTSTGLRIMGKEEPMIKAANVLKHNGTLGLVSDQHGGSDGISVPFFGVATQSPPGAAVFSYLTGAPIIPVQNIRLAPFRFRLEISPPLEWKKEKDRTSTVYSVTALVNKALEKMVLRAPGQWLWEHRRFREAISY
jgi:KDO2-lipid IV(A) lauroyltransferase